MTAGITFSRSEVATYYRTRVPAVRQTDAGEWRGPCPVHEGTRDSFAVNAETGAACCHSQCGRGWDILGLEQALTGASFERALDEAGAIIGRDLRRKSSDAAQIVATYDYREPSGRVRYQVVRMEPKRFFLRVPDGRGGWKTGKGVTTGLGRLPYRLPDWHERKFVCITEGEKDADALARIGVSATTNSEGACHFHEEIIPYFAGKRVFILPDNDPKGDEHTQQICERLRGVAVEIRVVRLPGLPAKGDVSDWLRRGGTKEQLWAQIEQAARVDLRRPEDRWVSTFPEEIDAAGGMDSFWDLRHTGLKTPFPKLTRALRGGLQRGEFYVLAAHSGIGKTSLGLQFADETLAAGKRVVMFSMEMGARDVLQRLIAQAASVDLMRFEWLQNKPEPSFEEQDELSTMRDALARHSARCAHDRLLVDTRPSVTPEGLIKAVSRYRERFGGIDLVIADHIQLMGADSDATGTYERMTQISRALKRAAKEADVPVLVLSQCNRRTDPGAELDLADLRDSGTIAEDAAAVLMLWHDKKDLAVAATEPSEDLPAFKRLAVGPLKAVLKLAKNRYGMTGVGLELIHEKRFTRFRCRE